VLRPLHIAEEILLALSSKLLTSRILVAKPYRNARFKKALILPVSSLLRKGPHPGRAYNILLTTIAWKTISSCRYFKPWSRSLFSKISKFLVTDGNDNNDCDHSFKSCLLLQHSTCAEIK